MTSVEIIHGDCIEVLARLTRANIKTNLIVSDPPYNWGLDYGPTTDDNRSRQEYLRWCGDWLGQCYVNLTGYGSLWVLINHEYGADMEILIKKTGFVIINWITWYETFGVNCTNKFMRSSRRLFHAVKDPQDYIFNKEHVTRLSARQEIYNDKRANPDGRLWDDVWGINPPIPRVCGTHAERIPDFPTQLPIKLLLPIVGVASNPGDLVIDPFSGSGTTGEACIKLRRNYIGIEINNDYMIKSWKRLNQVREESKDHVS